ncbi:MAG: DUF389 domain-containing protein [Chloroflexota bacterium]|nr:DUF389 domain-containing protein [Chloroflexota bacterium]
MNDQVEQIKGTARFSRVLGLNRTIVLGASVSVGVGIYILLGLADQLAGRGSASVAYILMMIAALPIILTYAERAGVTPGNGAYNLARLGGNLMLTFAAGWVLLAGYIALISLLAWGVGLQIDIITNEFFEFGLPIKWVGAAAVLLVVLNNLVDTKGSWVVKTVMVTGAVVMILIMAMRGAGAAQEVSPFSEYSWSESVANKTIAGILGASLWGLNIILGSRDSIHRPTRTIPLGLLVSVLLAGVLGAISAAVVYGYPGAIENPLAPLASLPGFEDFLSDEIANMLYATAGLFVLLLALNWATINGLRLLGDMQRDGYLPDRLSPASIRLTGPVPAVAVLGGASVVLLLFSSVGIMARLAALTFFWSVALIHIPDLLNSQPNLPENRRPKLPFHPIFPGLTVAVGLFAPATLLGEIWPFILVWGGLGALYYVWMGRAKAVDVRSQDMVVGREQTIDAEEDDVSYRVMVGISNPERAGELVQAGIQLALARNGSLRVLRIVTPPDQMPANLKQREAQEQWDKLSQFLLDTVDTDVPIRVLVRLAPTPADGIVQTVLEENIDLLLLGWEGGTLSGEGLSPDRILNIVVRKARCEVTILRGKFPLQIARVVVPTDGSPHAIAALKLAQDLVEPTGGQVSLINVTTARSRTTDEEDIRAPLDETLESVSVGENVIPETIESSSIKKGILDETGDVDLLMVGSSRQGISDSAYFGGLAAEIAFGSRVPAMVVRAYEPAPHAVMASLWDSVADQMPRLTTADRTQVVQSMRASAVPTVDFFVLIFLASAIAVLGLLQNSAAVIIGAMLVAPLMSPILGIAMGMVMGDLQMMWTAIEATAKGLVMAIFVGAVITIVSPIDSVTNEIMARTEPNILDLMIAMFSGAAAGYAICRKEVAAALPGVAIAAALVPPLTVVGYGLAVSRLDISGGALLLFITNLIAIVLAAAIVFLVLGFLPERAERSDLARGLKITIGSLAVISVLLGIATVSTVREINLRQDVEAIFASDVISQSALVETIGFRRTGETLNMDALVIEYVDDELSPEEWTELNEELEQAADGPVNIDATIIEGELVTIDVDQMDQTRTLILVFEREVRARSAETIDVVTKKTPSGFILESSLIAFDSERMNEEELASIQEKLSAEMAAPVTLRVIVVAGYRTELDGVN